MGTVSDKECKQSKLGEVLHRLCLRECLVYITSTPPPTPSCVLFISGGRGDSIIQITSSKIEVGLLRSNQEEARTPVLFYMLKT